MTHTNDIEPTALRRARAMLDAGAYTLPTALAAAALGRQPQTLHRWASERRGPVQPVRIGGRLAWPADAILRELGAACASTAHDLV